MRSLFALLLAALYALAPAAASTAPADLRILVDDSGSMVRTDPDHLRQPALRLAAELLPADARAGLWSFAEDVTPMVPLGPVDGSWRRSTRRAADAIRSTGQLTDLGAALESATSDWLTGTPPAGEATRHVVVFTDGEVDVAGGDEADRRARARILDDLLPRLREQAVSVHTIGLSDDIDRELMEQLARQTGGRFVATRDPDELERLFLDLFDQVAPRDSLPLEENRFQVDDAVSELTVVAFREASGAAVQLRTPAGRTLSAGAAGAGVRWRAEPHHALITVDAPAAGEWRIVGAEDPANRVMIVTDLQLELASLPAYAIAGEALRVEAHLSDGDAPIARDDFLELTTFRLITDTESETRLRRQEGGPVHAATITPQAGARALTVRASAGTFQREVRHRMDVLETPLVMERQPLPDQPDLERRLRLRPASEAVDPEDITVEIGITSASGRLQTLRFDAPDGARAWDIRLDTLDPHQDFDARVTAVGTMPDGRTFRANVARLAMPGRPEPGTGGPNWWLLGGFLLVFNIILFGVIGLVFHLIGQRRATPPDLSAEAAGDAEESTEAP